MFPAGGVWKNAGVAAPAPVITWCLNFPDLLRSQITPCAPSVLWNPPWEEAWDGAPAEFQTCLGKLCCCEGSGQAPALLCEEWGEFMLCVTLSSSHSSCSCSPQGGMPGGSLWPEWGHCPGVTPRVCAQPLPRSDLKHHPGFVCTKAAWE